MWFSNEAERFMSCERTGWVTRNRGNLNFGDQKEITMDGKTKVECGICYYQGLAKDFTPITVSANFEALECPRCLNNDADCFEHIASKKEDEKAA